MCSAAHLTPNLINKSYSECPESLILILVKVIDWAHISSLDVTILIILLHEINDRGPRFKIYLEVKPRLHCNYSGQGVVSFCWNGILNYSTFHYKCQYPLKQLRIRLWLHWLNMDWNYLQDTGNLVQVNLEKSTQNKYVFIYNTRIMWWNSI